MSELDPQNPVNLYGIPVTSNAPVRNSPDGSNQGDTTGGLIPYKNPKALIA